MKRGNDVGFPAAYISSFSAATAMRPTTLKLLHARGIVTGNCDSLHVRRCDECWTLPARLYFTRLI